MVKWSAACTTRPVALLHLTRFNRVKLEDAFNNAQILKWRTKGSGETSDSTLGRRSYLSRHTQQSFTDPGMQIVAGGKGGVGVEGRKTALRHVL